MNTISLILLAVSAIALILGGLQGLNVLNQPLMNVVAEGFFQLSMACSLFAIAIATVKPFQGNSGS